MITRVARRALNKAGARYASGFKTRTTVTQRGSGLSKADALSTGLRGGTCDAGSLMRVWPQEDLDSTDAVRLVSAFDSVISKGVSTGAATIGKAKALLAMNDFEGAKKALSSTSFSPSSSDYPAYLAAKADIAASAYYYYAHIVKAADTNMDTPSIAVYTQDASEAFAELSKLLSDDWSIYLAYGEHLLAKGDQAAAPILKEALNNANKEVASKKGKNEQYISDINSAVAFADYVDFKYQNSYKTVLGCILDGESVRTDKAMEEKLVARYPGLNQEELLAITSCEAAIEVHAFNFTPKPDVQLMKVKTWKGEGSMQTRYMLDNYTGGKVGMVQRSQGVNVGQELEMLATAPQGVADLENVVSMQKKLSVSLATQVRDRCKLTYAQALIQEGDNSTAEKLCTEIVFDGNYMDMYSVLNVRGQTRYNQGKIDGADQDFKTAFSLEESFEDADIPTMDKKAYRNEF
eukprot:TRINITY_DN372_c3_g1_i1.p1 TRINITY_DN372_c3_g1~~TRINITY_DN372_c3_g1_i1.p1  ORF type:complete len:463 (+),score=173.56 TRINITY_DN372_c3_g1_i1:76-1464(+)